MPKYDSVHDAWTIERLVKATKNSDGTEGDSIVVPEFQRGIVWSETKKRNLIDSIFRGYPLGSLLMFEEVQGAHRRYKLIDGLQRTTTITEFAKAPLALAPWEDAEQLVSDEQLAELLQALGVQPTAARVVRTRSLLKEWAMATQSFEQKAGFSPFALWKRLSAAEELETDGEMTEERNEAIGGFLDELKAQLEIKDVEIPIVIYRGPAADLPEIFERINTQGTQLNKYQVYAATWQGTKVKVQNLKIRQAIEKKWTELQELGYEIEGLDQIGSEDLSLFEYLFGLGKHLSEEFGYLFRSRRDPSDTEPVAFQIFTIAMGAQLADMESLPVRLPSSDGVIDPVEVEQAVMEAISFVNSVLQPYLSLRLNDTTGSPAIPHSDYQVISFVTRAFVGRYEASKDGVVEKAGWKDDWNALRTAIPSHYLRDILRQEWRGPIYKTLFARTWSQTDGEISGASSFYETPPTVADWNETLDEWFEQQLARRQRARPHVRQVEKVFLRFLYADVVSHYKNHAETFQLEHLYPVGRLKKLLEARPKDEGWPISCIANLALFPLEVNLGKLDRTISEYLAILEEADLDDAMAVRAAVEPYLLADVDDVSIPQDEEQDVLTEQDYRDFLVARWDRMRSELLDVVATA